MPVSLRRVCRDAVVEFFLLSDGDAHCAVLSRCLFKKQASGAEVMQEMRNTAASEVNKGLIPFVALSALLCSANRF